MQSLRAVGPTQSVVWLRRPVRTYADEGKSGLRIDGRQALQRLISDVVNGNADFCVILVYDVSRWGRFQDADESAYYEYICRRAGIQVAYCAEQFENDGSPVSTIVKGVKRAMAGEYSRELSAKVFAGQCRLIEMGFRQGGPAGYPAEPLHLYAGFLACRARYFRAL
jgi:DNA invertase Pin-like site-specific DNA recombinase